MIFLLAPITALTLAFWMAELVTRSPRSFTATSLCSTSCKVMMLDFELKSYYL